MHSNTANKPRGSSKAASSPMMYSDRKAAKPCPGNSKSSHPAFTRLAGMSPVRSESLSHDPNFYLRPLFPNNYLVCTGPGYWKCFTLKYSKVTDWRALGVIVPAYMTARTGAKWNGTGQSPRTNDNTGPIRFVVHAPEIGTIEEQARGIIEMEKRNRLVMVVQSAPDRLQAWFSTKHLGGAEIQRLRQSAHERGSSDDVFINCTPYAIPAGFNHRANFKHHVIYWNPRNI